MARKLDQIVVVDVESTCREGTHHRGGDDAWNIAAILGHLLVQTRG
jgi:hypothetical protein